MHILSDQHPCKQLSEIPNQSDFNQIEEILAM